MNLLDIMEYIYVRDNLLEWEYSLNTYLRIYGRDDATNLTYGDDFIIIKYPEYIKKMDLRNGSTVFDFYKMYNRVNIIFRFNIYGKLIMPDLLFPNEIKDSFNIFFASSEYKIKNNGDVYIKDKSGEYILANLPNLDSIGAYVL